MLPIVTSGLSFLKASPRFRTKGTPKSSMQHHLPSSVRTTPSETSSACPNFLCEIQLRQLHRDENVLFAGYKLPHPLQYKIIVRVHTTSQSSPMQAYNQAINDLDKELDHLKNEFEMELARHTGKQPREY